MPTESHLLFQAVFPTTPYKLLSPPKGTTSNHQQLVSQVAQQLASPGSGNTGTPNLLYNTQRKFDHLNRLHIYRMRDAIAGAKKDPFAYEFHGIREQVTSTLGITPEAFDALPSELLAEAMDKKAQHPLLLTDQSSPANPKHSIAKPAKEKSPKPSEPTKSEKPHDSPKQAPSLDDQPSASSSKGEAPKTESERANSQETPKEVKQKSGIRQGAAQLAQKYAPSASSNTGSALANACLKDHSGQTSTEVAAEIATEIGANTLIDMAIGEGTKWVTEKLPSLAENLPSGNLINGGFQVAYAFYEGKGPLTAVTRLAKGATKGAVSGAATVGGAGVGSALGPVGTLAGGGVGAAAGTFTNELIVEPVFNQVEKVADAVDRAVPRIVYFAFNQVEKAANAIATATNPELLSASLIQAANGVIPIAKNLTTVATNPELLTTPLSQAANAAAYMGFSFLTGSKLP